MAASPVIERGPKPMWSQRQSCKKGSRIADALYGRVQRPNGRTFSGHIIQRLQAEGDDAGEHPVWPSGFGHRALKPLDEVELTLPNTTVCERTAEPLCSLPPELAETRR